MLEPTPMLPGGSALPHAVASITGTVNGVTNPSYTYNSNGNMTVGAGRTVTWTSFNMAASVVDGATTIGLSYDDGHAPIKQTAPSGTTYYLRTTRPRERCRNCSVRPGMIS